MRDPVLWIALAGALALRIALLLLYPYPPGIGDETLHYVMGVLVSHLGHEVIGQWGPAYETFLAATFWVAGPDPVAPKIAQVLISTATVAMVYAIGHRAGGQRTGRIAAVICALYPSLVAYSTLLFSETLFLALIVGGMTPLFGLPGERTRTRCVAAGVLLGLATLTRSVVLCFLPVWIAWAAVRGRWREAVDGGIILVVVLAVVLPWTVRNWVRYGGFLLVDGTVAQTSYIAFSEVLFNTDLGFDDWRDHLPRSRSRCPFEPVQDLKPLPPVQDMALFFPPPSRSIVKSGPALTSRLDRVVRHATLDFPRMEKCETSRAFRFAVENPDIVARQMARRFYAFWGPNSFLLRSVYLGTYRGGPLRPSSYGWVKWGVIASYLLVMVPALFALGKIGSPGAPAVVEWSALFCACYTAVHMAAVAYSRYRLPVMPMAIVLGSLWLGAPSLPKSFVGRGIVAVLVAGFLVLSAHYVATGLP